MANSNLFSRTASGLIDSTFGAAYAVIRTVYDNLTMLTNISTSITGVTVANLPAAADNQYSRTFVTDADSTTFNSVVAGSGANKVPVFSDGTDWRIG